METFTCIIVDDEQLAIDRVVKFLNDTYPNIEIVGTYTLWSQALEALTLKHCDLLFLDIAMQDSSGMDLLRMVPDLKCEVIFITAHSEYALDAYKLSAAAYVLKPFDKIELTRTVNKVIKRISDKRIAEQHHAGVPKVKSNKIAVPNNNTINYINIEDIVYLEAVQGYTKIVTKDSELLCSYNIGLFAQQLHGHSFYQVHRSYLVNLNFVLRYETSGTVVMDGNHELPVSRSSREEFLSLFLKVKK